MKTLLASGVVLTCLVALGMGQIASRAAGSNNSKEFQPALETFKGDVLLSDIKKLSSDEFEGRAPGSHGEALTVKYLIERYRLAGLKPGNPDGSYVQKVPLVGIVSQATATINAPGMEGSVASPTDVVLRSRRTDRPVNVKASPVVFAGFGIYATEYGWDDYKGIDVRGKTLIVLDGEPKDARFKGSQQTYYSTRPYKWGYAAQRGAAAVLIIHDPAATFANFKAIGNGYLGENFDVRSANERLLDAQGWITMDAAKRLCSASGKDFAKLRDMASSRSFRPVALAASAKIEVRNKVRKVESHNVVAKIEGSDKRLKKEVVIYTAHWDHLGRNKDLKGDTIFNGAIDNAAGTAQMLQIAFGFSKLKPKRTILFISTTAEERGCLGARYYCSHPFYPVDRTVANINLDACNMWGPTTDVNNVSFGLSDIDDVLARAAGMQGRTFEAEPFANGTYVFLSDQIEFAKVGIPIAFPGNGSHFVGQSADYGDKKWDEYGAKSYHQVSDEYQPDWDPRGAIQDAQWMMMTGYLIAQAEHRPQWRPDAEYRRL